MPLSFGYSEGWKRQTTLQVLRGYMTIMAAHSPSWLTYEMEVVVLNMLMGKLKQGVFII